jgi:hypothetical protein
LLQGKRRKIDQDLATWLNDKIAIQREKRNSQKLAFDQLRAEFAVLSNKCQKLKELNADWAKLHSEGRASARKQTEIMKGILKENRMATDKILQSVTERWNLQLKHDIVLKELANLREENRQLRARLA